MPRLDETRPFLPVNIALLTVSDTATRLRTARVILSRISPPLPGTALRRAASFATRRTRSSHS